MVWLGKIDLEKEAPDHPFSRGCLMFVPQQPVSSSNTSSSTKQKKRDDKQSVKKGDHDD